MIGAIFCETRPAIIIRSDCRGDPRNTSAPKREMSKRDALMDIISIAQQANPKVIGQIEDLRAQLMAMSRVVKTTPSASIGRFYRISRYTPRMSREARLNAIAGASLALGIVILYLHPADQYFFGDSISVLISRSLTWRGAFLDLFRLGGHHWYRPLTNGIVQFLVWPLFGMNFAAYHYLAMAMHWAVCVGLYLGLRNFLDDPFAAWAGAAFYAFHPIQFYATYDVCFYQEPIGIGLTLAAVAGFYCYARDGRIPALVIGGVSFALALVSREIAVLTPGLLAILLWPARFQRGLLTVVQASGTGLPAFR